MISGGKPLFLTCSMFCCLKLSKNCETKNRTGQEEGLAPADAAKLINRRLMNA